MSSTRPDNVLRLGDGRLLGYGEYGSPKGRPLFLFHGLPGSRLVGQDIAGAAQRLGVRLIAPERPGYGLSDFKADRTLLDWPDDVVELAGALGLERFAVAGLSGGGPYAAACAHSIPERLISAGIIAGVGPFDVPAATRDLDWRNRLMFGLAHRLNWFTAPAMWVLSRASPDLVVSLMARSYAEPDRNALGDPEAATQFGNVFREAFRSGSRGVAWDARLIVRPWGFRSEDITAKVHLWYGEEDARVPSSMGRYFESAIPNCRPTYCAGEGHVSLMARRKEEILSTLTPEHPNTPQETRDTRSATPEAGHVSEAA